MIQSNRLVAPLHEQQLFAFRDRRRGQCFQSQLAKRRRRRRQLTLAAIDQNQIRQRSAFPQQPRVPPADYFIHRSEIISFAFDGANLELSIVAFFHQAVLADDHRGDVLRSLDIRNIERFDHRRKRRQLEHILQLVQNLLRVRLKHSESLLEVEPRILLDQIYQIALLTALGNKYTNSPAALHRQILLEQLAILEVHRYVDFARRVVAAGVILFQRLAEKRPGVKRVIEIFPVKLALADDSPGAHREERQRQLRSPSMIAEDIDVVGGDGHHLLLFIEPLDRPKLVAIPRRFFVTQLVRCPIHSLAQSDLEIGRLSLQQQL